MTDVVVIGAGPNGLVAANLLADRGLDVLVCEAQPDAGGAVRSGEITRPGFVHDRFSAFYPFAAASPVIRELRLENHGMAWRHAPLVLAHPTEDGRAAVLSRDLERTCASLDAYAKGDGDAWRELYALWCSMADPFMRAFTTPFPPVRGAAEIAAALGPRGALEVGRIGLLPARRLGDEHFSGEGGPCLVAGNALHADLTPETAGGGLFGWLLTAIGQQHGFPVVQGGASRMTEAMVRRLEARGGRVRCNAPVTRIGVRRGRAVGVVLADGERIAAPQGIVADVIAPKLYLDLVGAEHLPARVLSGLQRFQLDNSTVKVDWALREPIPWSNPEIGEAGTVHIAESMDRLTSATMDLERQRIPARPFLILGQYARTDPSRQPEGADTAWAYTHVPQHTREDGGDAGLTGRWDAAELERFAERMEDEVERLAPGFRDRVLERRIQGPHELEADDANLMGGAINAGTAKLYQQLVFRPVPGLGRPETPIRGLYLGSASAHPGGGVHGAPGSNAARALLAHRRIEAPLRALRRAAA